MRKTRDARHSRRLQAAWLVALGHSAREVARLLGASERWVNKWLARYRVRRRPEDLAEAMRPGRPCTDNVLTKKRIVTVLRSDPLKWGYSSTVWTVPLLTMHLRRECGTAFSERTVRRRIREVGFRWKRPRYVFAKARVLLIAKNLLSNAVKYTDSGSVNFLIKAVSEESWQIEVWDTGHGIPESEREKSLRSFTALLCTQMLRQPD